MKRDIQAVFFDAGYTLLCMEPDQPTIFVRVCSELGIELDHARFAEGVARANTLLAPRHPSEVPRPFSQEAMDRFWTDYNRVLLSVCGRDPGDSEKAELVYRRFTAAIRWRIYDEVHGVLRELRVKGIRLGIVSNWTGDLHEVVERVGLRESFDFVLDSARLGYEKPHVEIFDEAVRRAGVERGAALHVGDSPEHDVDGALASGLGALLLDRHARHPTFSRAPRVETLEGVLDHLQGA
jgi:HAD superfamily hydrolase (TIGR01549 family)